MDLNKVLDTLKNREVGSSEHSLREFKTGSIWIDICNELNAWLINSWELLEKEDEPEVRGRIRAIRETLNIIDILIERKQQEIGHES